MANPSCKKADCTVMDDEVYGFHAWHPFPPPSPPSTVFDITFSIYLDLKQKFIFHMFVKTKNEIPLLSFVF